ncbi:MAG: hypothetical protein LBN11_01865, partial [Tannerella sp.]|nr:hypothetical protein [Tannerella sp.]
FEQAVYSKKFCDVIHLYTDYFFRNEEVESSFWDGYGITIQDRERRLIALFILQYTLELCGILKDIHADNSVSGGNIISKVFVWLHKHSIFVP